MVARSEFENLYQDLLIEHSKQRHGFGLQPAPSAESHGSNRSCGDEITLQVFATGDTIDSVCWSGEGCAISQASASMLSDLAAGLPSDEATERINAFRAMIQSRGKDQGDPDLLDDAIALSGVSVYPARINCAMLAWTALEDGLSQIRK